MTAKKAPVRRDHGTKMPALSRLHDSGRTVSASDEDIRRRMIKDGNGQDVGKIEYLLIDDVEQKVHFLEIASGGFV